VELSEEGKLSTLNYKAKKHRTKLPGLLCIIFLTFAQPDPVTLAISAVFIILGESIMFWAAGYIRKNQELTMTGPYSLIRNPLYDGSFIFGIGFVIASGVIWLTLLFMVFFALIYWSTVRWEENKLQRLFPDQWPEYFSRVP
jgi:protein-S-isoprenylcysteine O-methyltransferase Ste14